MRVAPILPTPLLSELKDMEYNMCLYHIVKNNPEYAEFYRQQAAEGKFVLMDNGAAEGVNPTAEELMKVYPLVNPTEIILPDVVGNKYETLLRSQDAYAKFTEAGLHEQYRFMAVPQGRTFEEWLDCAEIMLMQDHIMSIGVSKFVTPKFQNEMGVDANVRLECVDALLQLKDKYQKAGLQIHLLGCWENPKEIGEINQAYGDLVRGTDSAIAYVYTRNDLSYIPSLARPDNDEIDFYNGTVDDVELLKHNIEGYILYCQG